MAIDLQWQSLWKDKQRPFRENDLVNVDTAFRKEAETHFRCVCCENDVGWVHWRWGREEARGVLDRPTSRWAEYASRDRFLRLYQFGEWNANYRIGFHNVCRSSFHDLYMVGVHMPKIDIENF